MAGDQLSLSAQLQLVSAKNSCSNGSDGGNEGLTDLVTIMYEILCGPADTGIRKAIARRCTEVDSWDAWEYAFTVAAQHIHLRRWRAIDALASLIHRVFGAMHAEEPLLRQVLLMYHDYISPHTPHIPPSVLQEIRTLIKQIDDITVWERAFMKAAESNALRWAYVRAVLANGKEKRTATRLVTLKQRTTKRVLAEHTAEQTANAEQRAASLKKMMQ